MIPAEDKKKYILNSVDNALSLLNFFFDYEELTVNEYIKKTEFRQMTHHSVKDASELLRLLDAVREEGYACDNEEAEYGLTCYARPILDVTGRSFAAVSISGPTTRMEKNKHDHLERLQQLVDHVVQTIV